MTDRKQEAAKARLDAVNNLRTAVAKLTEPYETRTPIRLGAKRGHRVHEVTHLPLITQLRNAIQSDLGVGAHNGASVSTRSLLNGEAFDLYRDLRTTIREAWFGIEALPALRYDSRNQPETTLADWLDLVEDADLPTGILTKYSKIFARWVERIENLFEPGEQLLRFCPECGSLWKHAASEFEHVSVNTLVVECIGCGKKWAGLAMLEELAQLAWAGHKLVLEA